MPKTSMKLWSPHSINSSSSSSTNRRMGCLRTNGVAYSCCSRSPTPGDIMTSSPFFLSSTPRKVSFEDSSCPSSGDECSDSDSSTHSRTTSQQDDRISCSTSTLTRKRSLLRRPKSTMSLVDLAKSAEKEEEVVVGKQQQSGESSQEEQHSFLSSSSSAMSTTTPIINCMEDEDLIEPRAKRICSPRVGPIASPRNTTLASLKKQHEAVTSQEQTPGPSPWGQFVDMLLPEDELTNSMVSPISTSSCHYLNFPDFSNTSTNNNMMLSSCRSRRSSPYGHYHHNHHYGKNHHRRSTMAPPPPSSLMLEESLFSSNNNDSKFRLKPRKSSSTSTRNDQELLIGALADLNF